MRSDHFRLSNKQEATCQTLAYYKWSKGHMNIFSEPYQGTAMKFSIPLHSNSDYMDSLNP